MTEPKTDVDRLTPAEAKRYKNGGWIERKTPLKKKRDTPRKVPLFTCAKQRCTKRPTVMQWCALHARKEADALFSKLVRARDGRCMEETCGLGVDLQCAHLISRRYLAVRWDETNAVALCIYHHKSYTENPLAWDRWCAEFLGAEEWDALKFRAERGGMPDLGLTITELRERLKAVAA